MPKLTHIKENGALVKIDWIKECWQWCDFFIFIWHLWPLRATYAMNDKSKITYTCVKWLIVSDLVVVNIIYIICVSTD